MLAPADHGGDLIMLKPGLIPGRMRAANTDQSAGLCASGQTSLRTGAQIHSALITPESVGNQKESKMYIGGGALLLIVLLLVFVL